MKSHPLTLIGWLLAATLLLSLVGLTAEPLTAVEINASGAALADPGS